MIYILYLDAPCLGHIANIFYNTIKKTHECQIMSTRLDDDKIKDGDILFIICHFPYYLQRAHNIRIFIINIDPAKVFNHLQPFYSIAAGSINTTYILDYQSENIKYFNKVNQNEKLKIQYLPPTKNTFFVDLFNENKQNIMEKDIDILFYGSLSPRRMEIFEKLKKYKFLHYGYGPFSELVPLIQRSKIVLNVYNYENNKPFEYYRISFLLSNNIFFITETPSDIDFGIESKLVDYDKHIVHAEYNKLVDLIHEYLNKSENERDNLAINAGKWYESIYNYEESLNLMINDLIFNNIK